jgi:hypothetical protein
MRIIHRINDYTTATNEEEGEREREIEEDEDNVRMRQVLKWLFIFIKDDGD